MADRKAGADEAKGTSPLTAGVAGGVVGLFVGMGVGGMLVLALVGAALVGASFMLMQQVQEQIGAGDEYEYEDDYGDE